eukprot:CAMPEP_0174231634 /NCGR_PEP_ID=MMETSP0417-20130205/2129_1 /TAXON_ID=242541 /ORGANISM="Mayorella sp, Strain BSH-02190019" /LENGTH=504 /DNA_ID=CAMNT_0015309559 /DNA_START=125 /DNA_END=1636 /DNA_ORIENTATION=+
MPSLKVKVKHGKELYKDVEVDTDADFSDFQAQLYSLTGVPPDAQQVSVRGKRIKSSWTEVKLRANATLLLIGSAEDAPAGPSSPTVFLEDLSAADRSDLFSAPVPAGLHNLGNTCYMNSTIQLLAAVPELRTALERAGSPSAPGADSLPDSQLVKSLAELLSLLARSHEPAYPFVFLSMLKRLFPQFDQKTDSGAPMQHDAEECFSNLIDTMQRKVPAIGHGEGTSAIAQLFQGERMFTLKCAEAPEEEATHIFDMFGKLSCHIGMETRFLVEGLRDGMQESLTKNSPTLGRDALYNKSWLISKLPYYCCVHFVRFYWKQKAGIRNKIVRPVEYPLQLDLFDFCTDELKAKLKVRRDRQQEDEDRRLGFLKTRKQKEKENADEIPASASASTSASSSSTSAAEAQPMEEGGDDEDVTDLPAPLPASPPFDNDTGLYELIGVLTHQGLSAEGGHYVAWVRDQNNPDSWFLFDDDKVSVAKTEDVLKLSGKGGAENHIAYMCLYRS